MPVACVVLGPGAMAAAADASEGQERRRREAAVATAAWAAGLVEREVGVERNIKKIRDLGLDGGKMALLGWAVPALRADIEAQARHGYWAVSGTGTMGHVRAVPMPCFFSPCPCRPIEPGSFGHLYW